MFTILFETSNYKQYSSEYIFETVREIDNYLKVLGFTVDGRTYTRKSEWGTTNRAYIQPMKKYKEVQNK